MIARRESIEASIKRQEWHIRSLRAPNHPLRQMIKSDRQGAVGAWLDSEMSCLRQMRLALEIAILKEQSE